MPIPQLIQDTRRTVLSIGTTPRNAGNLGNAAILPLGSIGNQIKGFCTVQKESAVLQRAVGFSGPKLRITAFASMEAIPSQRLSRSD